MNDVIAVASFTTQEFTQALRSSYPERWEFPNGAYLCESSLNPITGVLTITMRKP